MDNVAGLGIIKFHIRAETYKAITHYPNSNIVLPNRNRSEEEVSYILAVFSIHTLIILNTSLYALPSLVI